MVRAQDMQDSHDAVPVAYLERKVPRMLGILGRTRSKDVEIACAEDEGIEGLGDERDTCHAARQ